MKDEVLTASPVTYQTLDRNSGSFEPKKQALCVVTRVFFSYDLDNQLSTRHEIFGHRMSFG